MRSGEKVTRASTQGIAGHIWNLIGGSLVCGMVAGVFYLLFALASTQLYGIDTYWDLKYMVRIFVVLLVLYLVAPVLFARLLGGIFGSSKALKHL